ncbi:hypothetical protein Q9Q99_03490 [Curtobacterium flaccumfaciens]|nr:hypothetical protein Q9Q99_03490 [Curtobacterium flaccumfaciens]
MDLVLTNARLTDGRSVDVTIADGVIVSVADALPGPGSAHGTGTGAAPTRVVDCAGRVVIPGLIEAHLHVDKALLDRERPNPDGTLAGAIAVTGELKRGFTHATVRDRACAPCSTRPSRTARPSSAHTPTSTRSSGSPASRSCSTCATSTGTPSTCRSSPSPRRASREAPGTLALLRRALAAGADVIGGCTYNERTLAACHEHVETVLDLAEEFGVPADLHADFRRRHLRPAVRARGAHRRPCGRPRAAGAGGARPRDLGRQPAPRRAPGAVRPPGRRRGRRRAAARDRPAPRRPVRRPRRPPRGRAGP